MSFDEYGEVRRVFEGLYPQLDCATPSRDGPDRSGSPLREEGGGRACCNETWLTFCLLHRKPRVADLGYLRAAVMPVCEETS